MAELQSTLANLLTFCASFELGSFSSAARRLGVTPQAASRSVVRLEQTLGATLFRRTTRKVIPTEEAERYYKTAKQAIDLLVSAEKAIVSQREAGAATGAVRFSVPTSFGHHLLLSTLHEFRGRYTGIALTVHVGNRNVDFTSEGYDFAVRLGTISANGLIARKLGDFPLGIYAAPSYLARRRPPKTPAQLRDHDCIPFVMPSNGRVLPWTFGDRSRPFAPDGPVRCSDDVLALVTLARAGLGLVQTYDFLVERELQRGELVEVLGNFRGATRPFSIVYPSSPKLSPAARTLIDFILRLPSRG